MPHALVTGGAGFIGSHLCEALVARGYRVTCLDNCVTGSWDNVSHLSGLRLVEKDINRPATLAALRSDEFDVVFHYAATVGVRRTEEHPTRVLDDVQGIRHIAALARQGKAKKIIFASSSEVYGDPREVPEREEEGVMGWSPYANVKLYGEHLFAALWQEYGIPTVSLRFFNVYGPRQRGSAYGFVTARFIEQVTSDEPPTVFGTGMQTRDFVFIADNVNAALAAMDRPEANGHIINVGSGRETTVLDLAQAIIRGARQEHRLQPQFVAGRTVEIARRCASVTKLQTLLAASCSVPLEEGIRQTLSSPEYAPAPVPLQVAPVRVRQ